MKTRDRTLIKFFATAACLLGTVGGVHASDKSVTVFPAEGNKQCSDYSLNGLIVQMSPTTSQLQASGTAAGGGKTASYAITDSGTKLSFSVAGTSPPKIDYAVLKSGRTISVIIYPSGGVPSDANMTVPLNATPQPITGFSLCFGLGNSPLPPPPPPPPTTTKSCDVEAILDETGIGCPASGERTLVCNLELDKPFYGLNDGSDSCCVCNNAALTECDPDIPYDPSNPDPKACPKPDPDGKKEVTTTIELNKDPYYCKQIGSTKTCYFY